MRPVRLLSKTKVLLSIALLVMLCAAPTIAHSAGGAARNLVRNPGFEQLDDSGAPARWQWWGSQSGNAAPDEVFACEPEGHTGKSSISIREEGWGRRGAWYTLIDGVKPQRWYLVSLWVKRDRPTGWLPELELFGQKRVINLYNTGVWQKFDWLLNSGDFRGDVLLELINSRKPYKVWFDDVSVEEFWVEADVKDSADKLTWSSPGTSSLVVFKVEALRTEQFESDVSVLGETLNNEIPVPRSMSEGKWYWRVKAIHNGILLATSLPRTTVVEQQQGASQRAATSETEILPPAQPQSSKYISFEENLNLIVSRKPFFPVGIYSLPPEKFSEAKRAGFNTVLTDDLEAVRRAGLKAIVPRGFRYTPGANRRDRSLSPGDVNRTIIARYLCDEPAQSNTTPRELFRTYGHEKNIDPHHPTAIVVYRPENFWSYAPVSDILMTDPYPVPHRPLSLVSESVREATEAVHNRKPVWAVIQAFNWMDASPEARRTGWARWPTYEEERCMVYLAIINGAKGILFYRYCGEETHDPLNWSALKRVAGELRKLSPILLSPTFPLRVSLDVRGPAGSVAEHESQRIEYLLKKRDHRIYLVAANNWPGVRQVTFSFEEKIGPSVKVLLEKRKIMARPSSFTDAFGAYGVHVYQLELEQATTPGL